MPMLTRAEIRRRLTDRLKREWRIISGADLDAIVDVALAVMAECGFQIPEDLPAARMDSDH